MEEDSLIETILAEPEALGPRLVYADWLQLRGEPRGELAVVQLQQTERPDDSRLSARERELRTLSLAQLALPSRAGVRHALGFVDELDLETVPSPDLDALGCVPALQLVTKLRLGATSPQTIATLGKMPLGRRLRELHVGALDVPLEGEIVDSVANHLPQLTGIGLTGETLPPLGRVATMGLNALDVAAVDFYRSHLATILASQLALERLTLHVEPGNTLTLADLEPLLDGRVFPKLCHFGLARAHAMIDELVRILPKSALFPRLASMAISVDAISQTSIGRLHQSDYEPIAIVCPRTDPGALVAVAGLARARRRTREAIALFDEAVRIQPSVVARSGLAESLRDADRLEEAAVVYDAIIEDERSDAPRDVWHAHHHVLRDLGRFDEAIRSAEHARQDTPLRWSYLTGSLARLLGQRGRFDEAIELIDRERREVGRHYDASMTRLLCETLLEAGRFEDARETLAALAERAPDDPEIFDLRGFAALPLDAKEALRMFRRSTSTEGAIGSALAHATLGAIDEAVSATNTIQQTSTRLFQAALARLLGGTLMLEAGREKEARRLLGECQPKERAPEDVTSSLSRRMAKRREVPFASADDVDIANTAIVAIAASSLLQGVESEDVLARAEALLAWLRTTPSGFIAPRTAAWRAVLARVYLGVAADSSLKRCDEVVSGRVDREVFARVLRRLS